MIVITFLLNIKTRIQRSVEARSVEKLQRSFEVWLNEIPGTLYEKLHILCSTILIIDQCQCCMQNIVEDSYFLNQGLTLSPP